VAADPITGDPGTKPEGLAKGVSKDYKRSIREELIN